MDAKALAKSKRAHSQHHSKKPHSSQKPKPPLVGGNDAANAKKQTGKQIREKTHQAQRVSALPSNWDHYEEEFDSGSEDQSGDSTSQVPDVVLPKSKGADFHHLIAEAQSQLESNPYTDSLCSLDDILPGDFNQFVGIMLSVRGEGILSLIQNDNFVVEDRTTATHEASFLSLNLHALAEQLEKVNLSERLFIEEDLLPSELHAEGSKANSNQESDQMQTTSEGKAAAQITEELTLNDSTDKVNIAAKNVEHISFSSGSKSVDATLSNEGLDSVDEVYSDFISSQRDKSGKSRALESSTHDNSNSASVPNKKVSTFEAVAAEAELDMLLNSFSETKLLDSSGLKTQKSSNDYYTEGSPSLAQLARKGDDSSKSAGVNSSVDDLLDDLLKETSTMVNQGVDSSKSAAVTSTFDDLLQETSTLVNRNGLSRHTDVKAAQDSGQSSPSSHSVPKPKVLNDFDSWLDTI
ncbi:PREDICTED: uncharacterized protein LOC18608783 isoform X1 [Theobroma cacao]|uniref:Uncharacterized protein LOC18608783 isoform X1 n=1 Tax=Theobroma cacao TaxID=3641 RepID=A0AB32VKK4_THECC|nr:PREDICTED: uncharacterized protein LOC18608783 isoform X1 [Theobroma cacao]